MRSAALASAYALLFILTGCTNDPEDFMDQRQEQDAQLAERPSSESEVARLTEVRNAVRSRIEADLGLTSWKDTDKGSAAGCGDLDQSSGETRFLPGLLLTGGVPDAQWPRSVELVEQVAGRYGFGPADIVVDKPGEHEIVLRGERESLLRFGTLANATLRLGTGCHLPEDLLPRPAP